MAETIDYVPFMDRYPELKLRPVTEFPDHVKVHGCDYIQDLRLRGKKAPCGNFYLVVKNEKFGLYMCDHSWIFSDTTSLALKPEYDSIQILRYSDRYFRAIVCKNGKYGLYFWTYGFFSNDTYVIPTDYDSFVLLDNSRFKAVKDNVVTYFDATGHVLK